MLIRRDDSLLLVVDVQARLAPAIFDSEAAVANNVRLLAGAQQLGIPSFASEQYVRGLGSSVAEIRNAGSATHFFEKMHFSCTGEPGVVYMLRATGRRQIILTGMEAHVCVLQTAFGLVDAGFAVFLVADATSSRAPENRSAAIERMRAGGVHIVTTEMVLFEWLEKAGTDEFRAALPLIK